MDHSQLPLMIVYYMFAITVINTVKGNCPDDNTPSPSPTPSSIPLPSASPSPMVIYQFLSSPNTSVNAPPGRPVASYTYFVKLFILYSVCNAN